MKLSTTSAALAAALALATVSGAPALAMSDADCAAAWTKADANNDGVLTDAEAASYLAALRTANKPVADGRINKDAFLSDCRAGVFDVRANDAGAPLKGANSFTEAQARDRAEAHGVNNVTGLAKDADGVWRGKGQQDGKAVTVAIDFKGNVVVTP